MMQAYCRLDTYLILGDFTWELIYCIFILYLCLEWSEKNGPDSVGYSLWLAQISATCGQHLQLD